MRTTRIQMGTASLIKETKEMKMSYNMDTFSWDGHQIIAINPDFLENERRKVRQMSYLEAADYIMFGSAWSVIFKKIKWVREEKDGKATYTLDNSAAKYYKSRKGFIDSKDKTVVTFSVNGMEAAYRRVISGTIYYDSGKIVEIIPDVTTASDGEAMSKLTGGMWNALFACGREFRPPAEVRIQMGGRTNE